MLFTYIDSLDYIGHDSEVFTIPAGKGSVVIMVTVLDDNVFEGGEDFFANFVISEQCASKNVSKGEDDEATVRIEDDEGEIRVWFAPDMYTVGERDGLVTIALESSKPADRDYIVNVTTSDRTATSEQCVLK